MHHKSSGRGRRDSASDTLLRPGSSDYPLWIDPGRKGGRFASPAEPSRLPSSSFYCGASHDAPLIIFATPSRGGRFRRVPRESVCKLKSPNCGSAIREVSLQCGLVELEEAIRRVPASCRSPIWQIRTAAAFPPKKSLQFSISELGAGLVNIGWSESSSAREQHGLGEQFKRPCTRGAIKRAARAYLFVSSRQVGDELGGGELCEGGGKRFARKVYVAPLKTCPYHRVV
jgi:hypothetical protein